jgi:hypothetical protein
MECGGDLIWDARSAVVSISCGQGADLDGVMGEGAVSEPDSNSRDTGELGAVEHRVEVIDRQL